MNEELINEKIKLLEELIVAKDKIIKNQSETIELLKSGQKYLYENLKNVLEQK